LSKVSVRERESEALIVHLLRIENVAPQKRDGRCSDLYCSGIPVNCNRIVDVVEVALDAEFDMLVKAEDHLIHTNADLNYLAMS